jgi:hypothetical protein
MRSGTGVLMRSSTTGISGSPHYALPIEVYRGRPIFYGLGSFSFHTGHGGRQHEDWVGMMARIAAGRHGIEGATIAFVAAQ